jgi:hypothetical protein
MSRPLTIEVGVHFQRRGAGAGKALRPGDDTTAALPTQRVPRVARLMALALRLDALLRSGQVASYSELASLGHARRAHFDQVSLSSSCRR